jgi:hypothetical protein
MKIYMANSNFKRRRKKREEKKKASWVINRATTDHTHHLKKKGIFAIRMHHLKGTGVSDIHHPPFLYIFIQILFSPQLTL